MTVNSITNADGSMIRMKTPKLGGGDQLWGHSQATWPIEKSLTTKYGSKATAAIHGGRGLQFYPKDKAKAIADYLGKAPYPHDLCGGNHQQWAESGVSGAARNRRQFPVAC